MNKMWIALETTERSPILYKQFKLQIPREMTCSVMCEYHMKNKLVLTKGVLIGKNNMVLEVGSNVTGFTVPQEECNIQI